MDFYDLIESARDAHGPEAPSAEPARLRDVLGHLTDDELLAFGVEFQRELDRLNRWSVWDAGWVAAEGMSDDSFHYFRSWLIGKGCVAVEQALRDADGLAEYFDVAVLDNELLEYVPIDLLEERGVDRDPRDESGVLPDGSPTGVQVPDGDVERRHPRIAGWVAARAADPPQ